MITNFLVLTISAYCHCSKCCGKSGQPTASGLMPQAWRTIAASRSLPFGTMMMIPNVGWRKVEDRLAKKYDSRVDVFMNSHKEAKKFGIRKEKVQIITTK